MSRDLHPTEGARLLLERAEDRGASAVYRASIFTPAEVFASSVVLTDDGSVALDATSAPTELHAALEMLAKLTARAAPSRRKDGLPAWPSRVLRWRGTGRGL